jgi:hypothetical protein
MAGDLGVSVPVIGGGFSVLGNVDNYYAHVFKQTDELLFSSISPNVRRGNDSGFCFVVEYTKLP